MNKTVIANFRDDLATTLRRVEFIERDMAAGKCDDAVAKVQLARLHLLMSAATHELKRMLDGEF